MTELPGDPQYDGSAVIIGAGSVGSLLAAKLAKAGFRRLYILDRDILEAKNVARHHLGTEEIGQPKATALALRLGRDVSSCHVEGDYLDFLEIDEEERIAYLSQARLVVAATDSAECQLAINRICVARQIPAVYPGIGIWPDETVRHGEVGHILPVVPGEGNPCFHCYTAWRPQEDTAAETAAGRGGPGLDIDHFAGVVAWAVVSLLHPNDPHADVFDAARPLTLVHSLSRVSPAVQPFFQHGNIANLELSFPSTPCPVCGGREPRPVPPDMRIRTTAREMPPRRLPPATPVSTMRQDLSYLGVRIGWLLGTIGVLLILLRIDSAVHLWTSSNLLAILFWGVLDLAAIIFGLYMTFRGDDLWGPPEPTVAWGAVVGSIVLLVIGSVVLANSGGAPPTQGSPVQQPTAASSVGQESGSGASRQALPQSASTVFDVAPTFRARSTIVSGDSDDFSGNKIYMSLTPSLRGFELTLQVSATYSSSELSNMSDSAVADMTSNCLDVATPPQDGMQGTTFYEGPLTTDLASSGGQVTGSMAYAAVLPGSYSFDLNCLNANAGIGQSSVVSLGNLNVSNIGGALAGEGDNTDNGITVYAMNMSSTDTVILYGAIGGYKDGSLTNMAANSCINDSTANPDAMQKPATHAVKRRVLGVVAAYGARQWFQVGSLTFDPPISRAGGAQFYYGCSNSNNPYIFLH